MTSTTHAIEELSAEIAAAAQGMTPAEAAARISDPAAAFAVQQVLTGGALSQNAATLTALRGARRELASA